LDKSAIVLTANPSTKTAALIRLNGETGVVERRLPIPYRTGTDSPDLLLAPNSGNLYMAGKVGGGAGATYEGVQRLDARTLRGIATARVTHRIRYVSPGPTTMALSPSGRRLLVYDEAGAGTGNERDWLSVLNARSLLRVASNVSLPACGAERMGTGYTEILVLCESSSTIYFVDPEKGAVTGSLRLPGLRPPASNLSFASDRATAYVAGADLDIFVVDTRTHRLVNSTTSGQVTGATNGGPSLASFSDRYLVAAETVDQSGVAGRINVYTLPKLNDVRRFVAQPFRRVITEGGGSYFVPISSTTKGGNAIQRMTLKLSRNEIDLKTVLHIAGYLTAFSVEG
jgi:hypothetical protein